MQIIVLGMHRSGTSVIAGMLNVMGAYFAPASLAMKPKHDNPAGFWEREDVVQLNEALLVAGGGAWDRPVGFDWEEVTTERRDAFQERAREIVVELNAHRPWMIKDPRLCLTFSLWRQYLDSPVVVFVYRDPLAVAKSLERRNGIPVSAGLALWHVYSVTALKAIKGLPTVWVSFDRFTAAPRETAWRLFEVLDESSPNTLRRPTEQDMASHYKADLVHQVATPNEYNAYLTSADRDLMKAINSEDDAGSRRYYLNPAAEEVAGLYAKTQSLEDRLQQHNRRLTSWLNQLDEAERLYRNSLMYKVSRAPVNVLRRMPLAGEFKTAQDEVERILTEFRKDGGAPKERENGQDAENDVRTVDEIPPKSRVILFWRLLMASARNPRETLRLMSVGKLRDAMKVFFVLPVGEANYAVDNVLLGYRRDGRNPDLVFPTTPVDASELEFPEQKDPLVSVIVPAYNEYETNLACLKSVMDHTGGLAYEVILADDASQDKTRMLGELAGNVRVSRTRENAGFLANCNHAAEEARGRYLVFLNNDTCVQPGWLDNLVRLVEADSGIGVVGPQLLYPNGILQEAGGIVWRDGSAWNYGRGDDPQKPEYSYVRPVDYISGACLLIRTILWKNLGGFDEIFTPAYYEDTDLAFEARRLGYEVVYQPASKVVHREGVSHGTTVTSDVKRYQRINQRKFMDKWSATLEQVHYADGQHLFAARERAGNRRTVLIIDHYVPTFDRDAGSRSTLMYINLFLKMGLVVKFLPDNFYKQEPYTTHLQQLGVEVLWGTRYARSWKSWLRSNCAYLDYVYLHRPHVAHNYIDVIRQLPCKPKIIYFGHDLHYLRARREYEVTQGLDALNEEKMWRQKEFDIFAKSDVVYYPSQTEVDEIRKHDASLTVRAIPLYILDEVQRSQIGFGDRKHLMFIGGFNHPPNVDGLVWFLETVFPRVRMSIPGIKIYIMGSKMPERISRLASDDVVTLGSVSDEELTRQYEARRLSIVPLRFGAGIKGKILEAMQMRIPVVTTSIGAEGLPMPDDYLAIADKSAPFAQAIVDLYENETAWYERVERGSEILREHFSEQAACRVLGKDFEFDMGRVS